MLKNTVEYKRFVWELNNVIDRKIYKDANIVFLCIGTNTIVGDAFGPVVGSVLKNNLSDNKNIEILGDLKECVTYNDVDNVVKLLGGDYDNNLIIVLDSALSRKNDVGKVFVQDRGLKYAESLKKRNSVIGDISIKAVVAENVNDSVSNFQNLKNASFKEIHKMCNLVSNGIIEVMNKKENIGKNIYKYNS